jgi:vacuolar-type H+-ATPase subunit F/Vma7
MSLTVQTICRPEVAAGFGLAGLQATETPDSAGAAARLSELRARPEVGVILVEDVLYQDLPEELLHEFGRHALPMVVPFPGPQWEARAESAEAYIVELLRQVVGYRVRLI